MSTRSIRNTQILRAKIAEARAKTAQEVAKCLAEAAGHRLAFLKAVDGNVKLGAALDADSAEDHAHQAGCSIGLVILKLRWATFVEVIFSGDLEELAVTQRGRITVRVPYCRALHALLLRVNRVMSSPTRKPIEAVLRSRVDALPPHGKVFVERIAALI